MKKNKLLMPLVGIAALGASVPAIMTVTSCGNPDGKQITEDMLNISTDKKTLYGLKDGVEATGYETLVIPDTITTIADNAFVNYGYTTLPGVKKLVLGKNCNYFGALCFAFAEFNTIDFSKYPDDATFFKSGTFDDYAFYGFTEEKGTLIFNSNWNMYKKHQIKSCLYNAGLYSAGWYDYTTVTTKEQLREAAISGGNIKLGADIDVSEGEGTLTGEIAFKADSILDLNGHKVYASNPIWQTTKKQWSIFAIWGDVSVVVDDTSLTKTGMVVAPELTAEQLSSGLCTYCFTVRSDTPTRDEATLDIAGGTYYANGTVVYNWGGQVLIEDGEFHLNKGAAQYDYNSQYAKSIAESATTAEAHTAALKQYSCFLMNCYDDTYKAGTAEFTITGGKFYTPVITPTTGVEVSSNWKGWNPAASEGDVKEGTPACWINTLIYAADLHEPQTSDKEGYYEVVYKY